MAKKIPINDDMLRALKRSVDIHSLRTGMDREEIWKLWHSSEIEITFTCLAHMKHINAVISELELEMRVPLYLALLDALFGDIDENRKIVILEQFIKIYPQIRKQHKEFEKLRGVLDDRDNTQGSGM